MMRFFYWCRFKQKEALVTYKGVFGKAKVLTFANGSVPAATLFAFEKMAFLSLCQNVSLSR